MKKKVQLVFHQELTAANRFFFQVSLKMVKELLISVEKSCFWIFETQYDVTEGVNLGQNTPKFLCFHS